MTSVKSATAREKSHFTGQANPAVEVDFGVGGFKADRLGKISDGLVVFSVGMNTQTPVGVIVAVIRTKSDSSRTVGDRVECFRPA